MTIKPIVFDDSALIALFDAHPYVADVWHQCELTGRIAIFPAAAVQVANTVLGARHSAWAALLFPPVEVVELGSWSAVEAGLVPGTDFASSHRIVEAEAAGAAILTRRPDTYRWRKIPTLTFN